MLLACLFFLSYFSLAALGLSRGMKDLQSSLHHGI